MSRRMTISQTVQSKPTQEIATADDAQLIQLMDQWEAERTEVSSKISDLENQLSPLRERTSQLGHLLEKAKGEQLRRTAPFVEGDIVADDQDVHYRVHKVAFVRDYLDGAVVEAGQVFGVRLSKTGIEAYAKPRRIVSSKPLTKVEQSP